MFEMMPQTKKAILKLIEDKPIFIITTIKDPVKYPPVGEPRCVGFYYKFKDAVSEVENNSCDIYEEGYYPLVVIGEITQGIYPYSKETWFKWNKRKNGYVKTKKPKCFYYVTGFGVG